MPRWMRLPPMIPRTAPVIVPLLIVAALLLGGLLSCGEDAKLPPQEPEPDRGDLLIEAWDLYQVRLYADARHLFDRVVFLFPDVADGYLGVGWCRLETDSLPLAIESFQASIRLDASDDAWIGLAIAASALGQDSLAFEAAARVEDPVYVFSGDGTIGYRDAVYVRALAAYHLRRYDDCLEALRVLDPDIEIDMEAYDFRERLFEVLAYYAGRV